jgi:hypothetical protein
VKESSVFCSAALLKDMDTEREAGEEDVVLGILNGGV